MDRTRTRLGMRDDYGHVVSQQAVSEVRRLLGSVDRAGPTSVVMERRLRGSGLLGLRGTGREVWAGEDAQVYVDRLRREWERRTDG